VHSAEEPGERNGRQGEVEGISDEVVEGHGVLLGVAAWYSVSVGETHT
jgi:hypothetical protein